METLVAILIFSMVAVMLTRSFSGFLKNYMEAKKTQKSSESAQYVMNVMAKKIRSSSLPASPVTFSGVPQLSMFDNTAMECVVYRYQAEKIQVAIASDGGATITDISKCPALSAMTFNDLTNPKEIAGITFSGSPSSGTTFGRVLISAKVAGGDSSQVQTVVSLRDGESNVAVAPPPPPPPPPPPVDTTAPVTVASPAAGPVCSGQDITLTCGDAESGCDRIYYTTNGTNPTTSSTVYSAPIVISSNTTLKYFSKDLAGNSEAVKTSAYTIMATPAQVTGVTAVAVPALPGIRVSWNLIPGISTYSPEFFKDGVWNNPIGTSSSTYDFLNSFWGFSSGTSYSFRVRAYLCTYGPASAVRSAVAP